MPTVITAGNSVTLTMTVGQYIDVTADRWSSGRVEEFATNYVRAVQSGGVTRIPSDDVDHTYKISCFSGSLSINVETVAAAALLGGPGNGALNKAALQFQQAYQAGVSKHIIAGDSWGVGTANGVSYANAWGGRLQTLYSGRLVQTNAAVSSQTPGSYIGTAIQALTITPGDISTVIVGLNQIRRYGPSPEVMMDTVTCVEAMLAWLAVPTAKKIPVRNPADTSTGNPALTFTGTWTHSYAGAPAGTNIASSTGTTGGTVSFTGTGDVLYIWAWKNVFDAAKTAITIDGVDYGPFASGGLSYANWVGAWEPHLVRVSGLGPGQHTVTLNMYSAGTLRLSGFAMFNRNDPSAVVLAGQATRQSAAGWATGSGTSENLNDPGAASAPDAWAYGNGGLQRLHKSVELAVNSLQADGLNVLLVPTDEGFDPTVHIGADTIHPSGSGHGHLTRAFNQFMGRIVPS